MISEKTTWNGEPAISVRLDYDEANEYFATDDETLVLLKSLTEGEREEFFAELWLLPLRESAEYAIGTDGEPTEHLPTITAATTIWVEEDYDGALFALEGIDRAAYLEICDLAAIILRNEIREWDTESMDRLVELLTKLDETTERMDDRKSDDYIRMDDLPSAPIPEGIDTAWPIWAMDQNGYVLTGEEADKVEHISDVLPEMQNVNPVRCHKCGYTWSYTGRSQYRTTCPACHITVYLDKCRTTKEELIKYLQVQHDNQIKALEK